MKRIFLAYLRSFKIFNKYKVKFIINILGKILLVVCNIFEPFITATLISSVFFGDVFRFKKCLLGLIILNICKSILNIYISRLEVSIKKSINVQTKYMLLEKLLNATPTSISLYKEGKLLNIMQNDTLSLCSFIYSVSNYLIEIISVILSGYILFKMNIILSIGVIISFPLIYFINEHFGTMRERRSNIFKLTDKFMDFLKMITSNLNDIKANQAYKYIWNAFSSKIEEIKDESIELENRLITISTISKVINVFNGLFIIAIGGVLVMMNKMASNHFLSFNSYSKYFNSSLFALSTINTSLQQEIISVERYFELYNELDKDCCINEKLYELNIEKGHISFENIRMKFGERVIISNFNFTLGPGKIYGVIGKNGSGKTTLLRLIDKIYTLESGKIKIDSKDIKYFSYQSIMSNINFCSQEVVLYPTSVINNILLSDKCNNITKNNVVYITKILNIYDDIMELPYDFDTILDNDIRLSTGQRKKIQLARAFVQEKSIILFDEPTANLDYKSKERFYKYLYKLKDYKTIIVATNEIDDLKLIDELVYIS